MSSHNISPIGPIIPRLPKRKVAGNDALCKVGTFGVSTWWHCWLARLNLGLAPMSPALEFMCQWFYGWTFGVHQQKGKVIYIVCHYVLYIFFSHSRYHALRDVKLLPSQSIHIAVKLKSLAMPSMSLSYCISPSFLGWRRRNNEPKPLTDMTKAI